MNITNTTENTTRNAFESAVSQSRLGEKRNIVLLLRLEAECFLMSIFVEALEFAPVPAMVGGGEGCGVSPLASLSASPIMIKSFESITIPPMSDMAFWACLGKCVDRLGIMPVDGVFVMRSRLSIEVW